MDTMRKLFPLSYRPTDLVSLVLMIVIYVVAPSILGLVASLLMWLPIVNWVLGLVCTLFSIYCLVGLVWAILVYLRVVR